MNRIDRKLTAAFNKLYELNVCANGLTSKRVYKIMNHYKLVYDCQSQEWIPFNLSNRDKSKTRLTKEQIIQILPRKGSFRAVDIVDLIYPDYICYDEYGVRMHNTGMMHFTRALKEIEGIEEIFHMIFYIPDIKYFLEVNDLMA